MSIKACPPAITSRAVRQAATEKVSQSFNNGASRNKGTKERRELLLGSKNRL